MLKRFTSVILSLCIVATLFAGLNFSAFAAASDAKDNTVNSMTSGMEVEATRNEWLTNNGYEPSKSIIRDYASSKAKVYYYISSKEENPEFANVNTLTYGQPTRTTNTEGIELFTGSTISTGDTRLVSDYDLARRMFLTYNTTGDISSKPKGIVNDESKQYLQLNFELPAETDISSYVLMWGLISNAHHTIPGHWKIFVADNEASLWEDANCVSHVDNISATSDRVVGVNFGTAKRGKWLGLRLICPYNTSRNATIGSLNNLAWIRLAHFGVQGAYVNSVTAEGVTAKATNDNGEAEVSAVATLAGNTDKNGVYPYASVALTAEAGFKGSNSKIYTFEGWYLGEDKIADTATANYALTGAETTKEFTAKYTEKEYEEYDSSKYNLTATHYAGQLDSNPVADSLIVGKMPISAQVFNTIEGDFTVSNEPQDYTDGLSASMQDVTSATKNNGDARFFDDAALYKKMFIETTTNEGAFASMTATDDETKQWVQFNYELDGVADIDNILFGRYSGGSKWDVGHFKLILSDTEEGLHTLSSAKAVIEVNSGTNQYKANWNFAFTEDITAKYVGIRIISMYNNNYGTWTETNLGQVYPRFTHLGVHGTYVDPVEGADSVEVTVAKDAEVADIEGIVVTKAEDINYGNPDKEGKYGSASVTVTATELFKDTENSSTYAFEGWYNGDQKISDKAEYAYNLANGNATLTAKYARYTLDSSKYGIKNGYVRIEKGDTVYDVTSGFDQDKNNIAVNNGETLLQDHEFAKSGMLVELYSNGAKKHDLEIVYRGDYDGDKEVNVTDITAALSTIVDGTNATELETFRFDNGDGEITVTDIVNARKTILFASTTDYTNKTIAMKDLSIKPIGRSVWTKWNALLTRHAASGFVFTADCQGDITFEINTTSSQRLTVSVDGNEHIVSFTQGGNQQVVIAEGLKRGVHTIEILAQRAQDIPTQYYSINLNGEVLAPPAEKELLVEFVGDSITCGLGNRYLEEEGTYVDDASKAYGKLTANALDADWSNISLGGSTVVSKDVLPESTMVMPDNYRLAMFDQPEWDFENNRQADIVVINLGTNEYLKSSGDESVQTAFENSLYAFVKDIKTLNSKKDVKVVFAFGMMTDEDVWVNQCYQNVITRLEADGITVPFCQLPKDINGGGLPKHPSLEGHVAAAAVLSQFIKDNVLN